MIKNPLRVIIIGFGVQGKKRSLIASEQLISIVDPLSPVANFKDIKEDLKKLGHKFFSKTDTEVILVVFANTYARALHLL